MLFFRIINLGKPRKKRGDNGYVYELHLNQKVEERWFRLVVEKAVNEYWHRKKIDHEAVLPTMVAKSWMELYFMFKRLSDFEELDYSEQLNIDVESRIKMPGLSEVIDPEDTERVCFSITKGKLVENVLTEFTTSIPNPEQLAYVMYEMRMLTRVNTNTWKCMDMLKKLGRGFNG